MGGEGGEESGEEGRNGVGGRAENRRRKRLEVGKGSRIREREGVEVGGGVLGEGSKTREEKEVQRMKVGNEVRKGWKRKWTIVERKTRIEY